MAPMLTLSGLDARTAFGFVLASAPSWLDLSARSAQSVTIPGRVGATPLGTSVEGSKTLTLRGAIMGASAADARAKLDALKAALMRAPLTVTFSDQPDRFTYADPQSAVVTPADAGSLINSTLPVDVTLSCLDPLRYDVAPITLTAPSGTTAAIACGTGPVRPLLSVYGPSTNPVIALDDHMGALAASMVFNGLALVTGDVLVIDCDAMTIQLNGANAIGALTAGDFLAFEPALIADYRTSAWPRLGLTGGGTLTIAYRRSWR